ncbi:MAG: hypothetical protein V7K50_11665 [Nostoc sp.]
MNAEKMEINFSLSSMNLSLPVSLSETEREEQRKIQLFAPLSASERGWGRGQIRLVELTLILAIADENIGLSALINKINLAFYLFRRSHLKCLS